MTSAIVTNRHANNFDFLRLVFALFVIITHSFNLIDLSTPDWLGRITNDQLTFAHLGVCGFFTISGYLIIKSLLRSENIGIYLKKRVLRLFPGLLVVLTLTVIFGAFVTENPLGEYFSHSKTYLYVPANLSLYRLQDFLPGVFNSNPLSGAINGSLWTLPYEFACYLALIPLFWFRKHPSLVNTIVGLVLGIFFISKMFFAESIYAFDFVISGKGILEFGGYFVMGSLLARLNVQLFKNKNIWTMASLLIIIVLLYFNLLDKFSFIILPIFIIFLGLTKTPYLSSISSSIGDLSYGIYIYAFPVQQTLIHFGVQDVIQLIILASLITPVFAYFSWHLVEKRFLRLKQKNTP